MKPDGIYYYELLLVYDNPEAIMEAIGEEYELKDGYNAPEIYLGAEIERFILPDGKPKRWPS
jgi:hypothetical protein